MFESEWRFARIRSREVEDQVNAFYQQWDNMAARVHSAFDGEESDAGPSDDPTEWARSLLGLGTTFTDEQLRRAFGAAMQRHHPDHSGDNAIARTLTMARDALRARARSR